VEVVLVKLYQRASVPVINLALAKPSLLVGGVVEHSPELNEDRPLVGRVNSEVGNEMLRDVG